MTEGPLADRRSLFSSVDGTVRLALGLWGLLTLAHMALLASGDITPWLLVLPPLWTIHGLLLTAVLEGVIRRTRAYTVAVRWVLVGGAVVVLTVVQTWLDMTTTGLTARLIVQIFSPDPFGAGIFFWNGAGMKNIAIVISVVIYFWVFGCYAVASTLLLSQTRLAATESAAARAELMALRFQLNPHFVFNALNSVSSLIVSGRTDAADQANLALAGFLRRSLESDPTAPVTLDDELEMIDAYLDIERVRFPDNLDIDYLVTPEARSVTLPPYLLQPLVENAVKHGVAGPGRTRITVEGEVQAGRLRVAITNIGPTTGAGRPGTGTGLTNIRARLAAIHGDAARLETGAVPDGFRAVLELPIPPTA